MTTPPPELLHRTVCWPGISAACWLFTVAQDCLQSSWAPFPTYTRHSVDWQQSWVCSFTSRSFGVACLGKLSYMASKASLSCIWLLILLRSPCESSLHALWCFPAWSALWNQQGKLCARKYKGLRRGLLGCSGDWTWQCQGKYWLQCQTKRQIWLNLDWWSQRQSRRKAGAHLAPCARRTAACAPVSSLPDQTMARIWQ